MAEYKTAPGVEILGAMAQSIFLAFPEGYRHIVDNAFHKNGIKELVPQQWYPLQTILNTVQEIEHHGGPHLLRRVGEQAARMAPIPKEVRDFKSCLMVLNKILAGFHRGGNPGAYEVSQEEIMKNWSRFDVVVSTPFPCSLTAGYLEEPAIRFRGQDEAEVMVRHDEEKGCRRNNNDTCTYVITIVGKDHA